MPHISSQAESNILFLTAYFNKNQTMSAFKSNNRRTARTGQIAGSILLGLLLALPLSAQKKYKRLEEANGLEVGAHIKNFTARDAEGKRFSLREALQNGPLVLMFYRGQWCPVCNRHLSQMQDSLGLLTAAGATFIAVSPEKPEYAQQTAEKTGATFRLLYDEGYAIADLFDVTFLPPKATRVLYNTAVGAHLKEAHSDDSERLPIPATFIIDQKGTIVWRQFDPNYKVRASMRDILTHLPAKKP